MKLTRTGRTPKVALSTVLIASASAVCAQDEPSNISDWYLSATLGISQNSDTKQEGWNLDTFCYPDAACFDETPIPTASGYRWNYDIDLDRGSSFELSIGRYFGRTRLELALAQQTNETNQMFAGLTYRDGTPIGPRTEDMITSNAQGQIDRRLERTLSIDAYYDFPGAWGTISPYIGFGLGQAHVEYQGVQFATNYRPTGLFTQIYNPALSFYNSSQNEDLSDRALLWRVHTGANYELSSKTSIGLRLTWTKIHDLEAMSGYETHPMHSIDPNFSNVDVFESSRDWTLMLKLLRRVGN